MANQIATINWIKSNIGDWNGGATVLESSRCPAKSEILENVSNSDISGTYDDDQCVREEDIMIASYTYTVVNNTSYSLYLRVDNVRYGPFSSGISTFETDVLFTSSSSFSAETSGAPWMGDVTYDSETFVITISDEGSSGSTFRYMVTNETSENVEVTFSGTGVSAGVLGVFAPGISYVNSNYYMPGISNLNVRCYGQSTGTHYVYVVNAATGADYDVVLTILPNAVE